MKYLVLIYHSEQDQKQAMQDAASFQAMFSEYFTYNQLLQDAKVYLGGNALQSTQTATTVRVRQGKATHTDGPFAETKEALGGYYLLDCANLDEALKWAAKCPGAKWGSVEVRPVQENAPGNR